MKRTRYFPLSPVTVVYSLSWIALVIFLIHGVIHHPALGARASLHGFHHHCEANRNQSTHLQQAEENEKDCDKEHNHQKSRCPLCTALSGNGFDTPNPTVSGFHRAAKTALAIIPNTEHLSSGVLAGSISPRGPPLLSL